MTTEDKALALVNEVRRARGLGPYFECDRTCAEDEALCRSIEQHEAFRQEVSDVVENTLTTHYVDALRKFIIPKSQPDPLVRVINEVIYAQPHGDIDEVRMAGDFHAALEALGFEIREKNDG